jgi:GT2 family glycosyltransferase
MSTRASVVVPVHGRAALTRRCLDALLSDLPGDCEAIVVDDASTDDTPAVLAGYGEAIRTVRLPRNGGFAGACNAGAALAGGAALVFLNNDCEPGPGWLEALLTYAESHPEAAAIGAKLVYPKTGTVQHAGVVFGQDGYPHHLYAGFPADHPAVNRPRRLQAVTGACLLVRRGAFDRVGGFDTGFVNSLEDVDLCLRIGEEGGEVHYCPAAEVVHLESATRGQESRFERSVDLYRRRWRGRVRRDDLLVYAEDGLIKVEYPDSHPIPLYVSPLLASLRSERREPEVERLLETYARQVSDLLQEVFRLTAELADRGEMAGDGVAARLPAPPESLAEHSDFLVAASEIEERVRCLQEGNGLRASRRLGYRRLVERIRAEVSRTVPRGETVLVVSRGDRDLLRLDQRIGRHFPEGPDGGYLGYHPSDSDDAIGRLEALREDGAQYLVLPISAYWWLEHYGHFADHLRDRYAKTETDCCAIYRLAASG